MRSYISFGQVSRLICQPNPAVNDTERPNPQLVGSRPDPDLGSTYHVPPYSLEQMNIVRRCFGLHCAEAKADCTEMDLSFSTSNRLTLGDRGEVEGASRITMRDNAHRQCKCCVTEPLAKQEHLVTDDGWVLLNGKRQSVLWEVGNAMQVTRGLGMLRCEQAGPKS